MKLSELKPCAICRGPLVKKPVISWYVIRVSTALLHPQHARQTLSLMNYLGGALPIAEAMAPNADEAVAILGDQPGAKWDELHVCMDCYGGMGPLVMAIEQKREDAKQKKCGAGEQPGDPLDASR